MPESGPGNNKSWGLVLNQACLVGTSCSLGSWSNGRIMWPGQDAMAGPGYLAVATKSGSQARPRIMTPNRSPSCIYPEA
jgi:hypothetical protein